MSNAKPETNIKKEKKKNILVTLYLVVYNAAMCGGWGYLLYLTIMNYVLGKGPEKVLDTIFVPLHFTKTTRTDSTKLKVKG